MEVVPDPNENSEALESINPIENGIDQSYLSPKQLGSKKRKIDAIIPPNGELHEEVGIYYGIL